MKFLGKRTGFILLVAALTSVAAYSFNTQEDYGNGILFEEEFVNSMRAYGRISREGGKGSIYALTDPVNFNSKLDLQRESVEFTKSGDILLTLDILSNYPDFISKWEIGIYDGRDEEKLAPIGIFSGDDLEGNFTRVEIQLDTTKLDRLTEENEIFAVLKVWDEDGNFDETNPVGIKFNREKEIQELKDTVSAVEINKLYTDNRRVKNILVKGSNVKIFGKGLEGVEMIKVGDQEVKLDSDSNFLLETHLTKGIREIPIEIVEFGGDEEEYILEVEVPENYQFLTAIADFTLYKNSVSGDTSILDASNSLNEDFFSKGRLAFYYKGILDKYRITAHGDTWDEEIKNIFSDLSKRTPDYYYRKIDYDPIRFNYGDDSLLFSDVDTQGKMYLRVDWDKSQALWGSYNTGFTGSKYGSYNRTLYGGKLDFNSVETNKFGDTKNHLAIFGSDPDSVYAHDEFLGTGGSYYYLNYRDIVVGSAKLAVELRDPNTGRVLSRVSLQEGPDYEINEFQGLIRLKKPLAFIVSERIGKDIIKDEALSGNLNFLVVDYEYYSDDIDMDNRLGGVRGKTWIGDSVAIGATYVDESRGEFTYDLKGTDLTLKKSEGTYLRGEYYESRGHATYEDKISFNGGLEFFDTIDGNIPTRGDDKGSAYLIEGSLALRDLSERFSYIDRLQFWYDKKESGFSMAGDRAGVEKENYGIELDYLASDNLEFSGKYEVYNKDENLFHEKTESVAAEVLYGITDKISVGAEVKHERNRGLTKHESGVDDSENNGDATLVGSILKYKIDSDKKVYAKAQGTVERSGGYEANNMVSVGAEVALTEKLTTNGELSTGTRGNGGDLGLNYNLSDRHQIYGNYTFLQDSTTDSTVTFGQSARVGDRTRIYQENQFIKAYNGNGYTQGYGIDYKATDNFWIGALYQSGEIGIDSGKIRKEAISFQSKYEKRDFLLKSTWEISLNRGDSYGSDTNTYATANRLKKVISNEYTLFGVGNYLWADNRDTGKSDARNAELGLGVAYRPIWSDRLNVVGKYTYLYDLGSIGQSNSNFGEKAHVGSMDLIYQLTNRWDISFKYAIREESMRIERDSGKWYNSTLDLLAVRLDYEIVKKWDIFGEYHWLRDIHESQIKHGAMVGVYYKVTPNLKAGVGYNFTQFNDDLTNLDYKAQGWFFNIIGIL